jgi:hypothetical protein
MALGLGCRAEAAEAVRRVEIRVLGQFDRQPAGRRVLGARQLIGVRLAE